MPIAELPVQTQQSPAPSQTNHICIDGDGSNCKKNHGVTLTLLVATSEDYERGIILKDVVSFRVRGWMRRRTKPSQVRWYLLRRRSSYELVGIRHYGSVCDAAAEWALPRT